MSIGFTHFDEVPVVPQPTTAELVAALTAGQRTGILNGFANKILPNTLKYSLSIPKSTIVHLYNRIDAIEEYCRILVRGELEITPAVVDPETGEITTPAVYEDVPSSVAELKIAVDGVFGSEFTAAQSGAIVDKMIDYSKYDGSGDAAYYLAGVSG